MVDFTNPVTFFYEKYFELNKFYPNNPLHWVNEWLLLYSVLCFIIQLQNHISIRNPNSHYGSHQVYIVIHFSNSVIIVIVIHLLLMRTGSSTNTTSSIIAVTST